MLMIILSIHDICLTVSVPLIYQSIPSSGEFAGNPHRRYILHSYPSWPSNTSWGSEFLGMFVGVQIPPHKVFGSLVFILVFVFVTSCIPCIFQDALQTLLPIHLEWCIPWMVHRYRRCLVEGGPSTPDVPPVMEDWECGCRPNPPRNSE